MLREESELLRIGGADPDEAFFRDVVHSDTAPAGAHVEVVVLTSAFISHMMTRVISKGCTPYL